MAATKAQRIGIWIIAIFMAVGTIGSFAIIVLANKNSQDDQARFNELYTQYQAESEAYQEKVNAQAQALSDKYYDTFKKYLSSPAAFDKASVTELKKKDLVKGAGDELTSESTFTTYYIGWNPTGKVFDSSFEDDEKSLKAPFTASPGSVIEGWTEGVDGMRVGGVRELTIPSELAYGSNGQGDDIPADTPLKFIIMVVPAPETIAQPEMSQELINLYSRIYGY